MKKVLLILICIAITHVNIHAQATYQWNVKFGGNGLDAAVQTCRDNAGNIYTVGTFQDTVDFNPSLFATYNLYSYDNPDVFIVKLNANGGFIWAKQLSSRAAKSVSAVHVDNNNNVYIVGSFKDSLDVDPSATVNNVYSAGNEDIYIVKLNSTGNFVWAKTIGSNGNDKANDIKSDASNDVYICGYYTSNTTVDFDPGSSTNLLPATTLTAGFLLKLNSSGDFVWANAYSTKDTKIKQLEVDKTNNIIYFVAEYANNINTSYVNTVNATNGNSIWQKQFTPSGATGKTFVSSIAINFTNEYIYLACAFQGSADFNPDPSINLSYTSKGDRDICIVKMNSLGELVWAKQIGGTSGEDALDIAVDPCDYVLYTGFFSGTSDFDPNAGVANLTADIVDIYFSTLNFDGTYKNAYKLSGTLGVNFGNSITSVKNNLYIAGFFTGILNFDNNAPTNLFALQTSSGLISGYVARYSYPSKINYYDTIYVCRGSSHRFPDGVVRVINSETTVTSNVSRANECDSVINTFVKLKEPSSATHNFIACDSIVLNNKIYYNTTVAKDTLVNSVGCDSIVTYNITINKKSVFNNPKSICEGDTIFLFGKKYYQNGIYYDTLTNSKNCDSIIITQLEVRETYIFNNIQNICFGTTYNINGKIYNTNGIYYDTLTNIKNCDSIIITNLTINSILSENNNVTICAGSTYTLPKGTVVSTAGTYRDTIKNNLGCDSVVVTNLTVASILSENNNVTICAGSTYTLPKGTIVSTAGTYRDTIKNNQGCDSVVVTNLTVASVLSENNNVTICAGSTYTLPKGTVVSTAGTYRDTIKNNLGCDSVVVTNLTVASILSENNNVTICAGSTYTLPKGIIVSTAGTYRDTIKNNQGCDSVVVTNLTIASALSENNNVTICAGSTYTLPKGTIVSTAGTYRDTIKNNQGCDSVVVTNLTVASVLSENNNITICSGSTYTLPKGTVVSTAGTYRDTIKNNQGCDSVVVTNLTVASILSENNNVTICAGSSYTLPKGTIVSTAGTYKDTIKNNQGCDSVVITKLTISPILSGNNNVTICAGSTYTLPKGTVVSTAGTYRDTIKNNQGCDSVVVTNLTVASVLSENNNVTICAGSTYTLPKGTVVSTAGTYKDTIKNNQGCDSVVVTNLTVASVLSENNNVTICAGSTYTLPKGTVVSNAGTYKDTIKNNQGCDSIVITNLTVASVLSEDNNVTICAGSTYTLPKGTIVSTAGTYRDTIKNNQGCDSVVVTNLTVASILSENNNVTICAGSTYTLPKGNIVSTAGTYRDTIKNNLGCDSVIITNLTVASVLSENNNVTICAGSTYTLPKGTIVSTAGTYRDTIKNNQGCDSVVVTNLTVASILSENNNVTICAGSTYTLPKGNIVSTAGTYRDTIKNNLGCDSVIITNLTVASVLSENNNVTICAGSTYTLPKGTIVSAAGTYRDTIKNNQGCDSVVVTNLTVASILSENNNVTICAGSSYTLPKGTIVSTAGTYRDTIKNNQGCDSVVITKLTFASILSENNNVTICAGSTYTLPKGNIVSTAGTYRDTIKNNNGCDSVVVTNLTIASILSENNNVTICAGSSYTLPKGNIVSTAGTYRDTIKNNNGCDSVVVTNLTIASILSENNNVTICAGSSYTLPKGTVVSTAGTYRDTIKNNQGCDSVVVTNLTVASALSGNNNVTICAGSTYTLPKGTVVSNAGTYKDTIKNNQGCDSVVVTKLTISPILIGNTSAEFCQGTSYILPSGKSVSNAGTYKDTIKNNRGCDSIVTIKLTSNPIKETRLIDSACSSDNYEFFGSIIISSGVYTHKLQTSKGCDSSIVLNINISPNPTLEIKPNKIKIEKNDTVYLDINSDQTLYNIIWQPADLLNNSSIQNPFAILQDITQFKVQAENEFGCVSNAEIEILINTEDCIYLPNTFTPNGNGINETFRPLGNRIKSITIFRIFDRWGNLVFETNDLNRGWDGTYKGVLLDPNVFIYYIEAICKDGTTSFKKGNVTLLR